MARLVSIRYVPHRCQIENGIRWVPVGGANLIEGVPQIIWGDGVPWREANLWALERATAGDVDIKTVESNLRHLYAYSVWLEMTETDWRNFPPRKADRCLVKYRGALIKARDSGDIAPSTATARMASTIQFYRFAESRGLVDPASPMWGERQVVIYYFDKVGFERTMKVASTDLAIPNRKRNGERLEDGLLPVTSSDRDTLLMFAKEEVSEELYLMLMCGFFSGMRIQTLANLKVQTLDHAIPDPSTPDLWRLAVGPGASPPVSTKFSVSGHIWIPTLLLDELRKYAYSVRRLERSAKAVPEIRDFVFLTRFGNSYAERGYDKSPAINRHMSDLRRIAMQHGHKFMRNFHFHQSRCTFATELARLSIKAGGAIVAIAIVKEALLHKNEATAFKYIKFVEKTPAMIAAANAFTQAFLGVANGYRHQTNE